MKFESPWLDAPECEMQIGGEANTRVRATWIRLWIRIQSQFVSSMVWSNSLELKVRFTGTGARMSRAKKRGAATSSLSQNKQFDKNRIYIKKISTKKPDPNFTLLFTTRLTPSNDQLRHLISSVQNLLLICDLAWGTAIARRDIESWIPREEIPRSEK